MEFLPREQRIRELQQPFQSYLDKYGIDDIGIFEEHGEGNHYYLGYTVNKGGKTYHIHSPYIKNDHGELATEKDEWTLESDDPNKKDQRGYDNLESVLRDI
ncbi:hypothetical protein F7731_12620 [Cytobacillus depressus]|uniref:GK1464-like domain-containing protein n=1 Tax=Cytobacillus depressus TaxID=1602942 RepID=A0A6L3V5H7_9BACI|nr:DUF5634 family protein [Cytobacillus depressus]KAB2336323.1 hypothetical protein F7731_12620 [Cytobacillus depressus]